MVFFPVSLFLSRLSSSLLHRTRIPPQTRLSSCSNPISTRTMASSAGASVKKEDVVIVGGGIAGLATAVSLHRLGVRSVVLEQADSLRTGGASLTLSKNGWKVLGAIGVGDELRAQFLEIRGVVLKSEDGRVLRSFTFQDGDRSQEARPVERRILLETLANQLPPNAISFSSKLANIETSKEGETLLQLVNGTQLSAKIVIGCDGIHSPISKWMGFSEPKYVGYCAYRGLGYYPDGQPYEAKVNFTYGRGVRTGYVPISNTKVYWFILYNSSSPGPTITDPSVLKKQTQQFLKNMPSELTSIINSTPNETLSRTPIADRWLWPVISPAASSNGVVLVGDAWHPMTPNLGQGACLALEDAIVLARKLAPVIKSGQSSVAEALKSYQDERWPRLFPLTVRSNLVGRILQMENPLLCSFRNNVLIPKVKVQSMFGHTNFECEPL